VAWERDHKVFYEIKVYVVSLVLSLVFKTVFGIFLAHPVGLKSVKKKMSESSQVLSYGIFWFHALKRLLGV
jgi:hypothetical protein